MKMNTFLVLAVVGLVLLFSGCTQQAAAPIQNTANDAMPHDDTQMTGDAMHDDDAAMENDDAMTDDHAMDETTSDDHMEDAHMDEMTSSDIAHFVSSTPANGYKAEYTSVSKGSTGEIESELTMYVKSPKFRNDSKVESSGFSIETRSFYELNGTSITSCSNFQGSWNCQTTQMSESNQPAGSEASNPDLTFEADGTKTVAGETGTCFKGHSKSHPEQMFNLCYTNDGILVYYFVNSGQGATSEMTLKSVTRGIEDAVFVKPA